MNTHFKSKPRRRPVVKHTQNGFTQNRNNNQRKPSTLNPQRLINQAVKVEKKAVYNEVTFSQLDLNKDLLDRIAKKGYAHPTEIQHKTIESLISGKNVLGLAQTGSGKTGAFLIPIVHQLLNAQEKFETLIVVPTRELALQVQEEFKSLTTGLQLRSTCLIGGTNIQKDIKSLRQRPQVVIGTPGRLIDLIDRKHLRLTSFKTLVLDEFDRMLDMGFVNDVKRLSREMHNRQQTVLFSATENKGQQRTIDELVKNPVEVRVASHTQNGDHINQDVRRVQQGEDKFQILLDLLRQESFTKVLVFDETKRRVDRLAKRLNKANITADQIHGDKSQNYRVRALKRFQTGAVQILVATDVAARGIDVDDVTHVINYQLPQDMESYIHRIGRTGRAGKAGHAITLID